MRTVVTTGLQLAIFVLLTLGLAEARAQETAMKPLPQSAWQVLEAAEGIQVGGSAGTHPSIQVIFDANCPHCARLYEVLKREHPDVSVRWIPIAYFRADSGTMAAAIVHAPDPAASLDRNFGQYDFKARHGGFRSGADGAYLSAANFALGRKWRLWGGFTPMIVIRNRQGQILRTGIFGSTSGALRRVVSDAGPPQAVLKPYRPIPMGKD